MMASPVWVHDCHDRRESRRPSPASAGQLPAEVAEAFAAEQRDLAAAGNQFARQLGILTAPGDGARAALLGSAWI